ncbi:GNAT family N-acetyltransferase [Flavobacteriaceae bacterium F89]|uniref:GNAT family N-acetyltransferase n=1 Tax=Cerina litoralis TaxID=2874477 RepID=A0AAE3JQ30_9FLAO|nr:GNAT family N-acetyltransferase [Cerina litoralis]MCG2461414.1 GNAT family N-acetyltransferase [Cerina litoralis]
MEIEILRGEQLTTSLQQQVTELYKQLSTDIVQLSLKEILEEKDNMALVVCKEENQVVGIAMMAMYKVISGHKGMIEDVVVDQSHRGKGIGRKLMEKLLEEGRNRSLDEILLFSGHHRTPAITLYKSLGFQLKNSGLYRLVL